MNAHLTLYIKECLRQEVRTQLAESTPRIFNLEKQDILRLLDDILSGEPILTYTEKLAGTFFEIKIDSGEVFGRYKDTKEKGYGFGTRDESGVPSAIQQSGVFDGRNEIFQFEIINPDKISDYIDYALNGKILAVEVTGKLSQRDAASLNRSQSKVRFLTQADILKRPKPLSQQLRSQLEDMKEKIQGSNKLTVDQKKGLENLISRSLVAIFGDSVVGGRMEGLFVTGASKSFKIPEEAFASIQRLQAPIYAMFSGRGSINQGDVINRLKSAVDNPGIIPTDKMIRDIKNYLEVASQGFDLSGFRTFFTREEAQNLLRRFNNILAGIESPHAFVHEISARVSRKYLWVKA